MCHMLTVTCHKSQQQKMYGQSGKASWWRVYYQWGLPCLVYTCSGIFLSTYETRLGIPVGKKEPNHTNSTTLKNLPIWQIHTVNHHTLLTKTQFCRLLVLGCSHWWNSLSLQCFSFPAVKRPMSFYRTHAKVAQVNCFQQQTKKFTENQICYT